MRIVEHPMPTDGVMTTKPSCLSFDLGAHHVSQASHVLATLANESQQHMCNIAPHCQHGVQSTGNIICINTQRIGLQE